MLKMVPLMVSNVGNYYIFVPLCTEASRMLNTRIVSFNER